MIKIGEKKYAADQAIEIVRDNTVPIQPVERGFDVQDHISINPLQVRIELIIFEQESVLHGQWECESVAGRMVCEEMTAVDRYTGTYEYLMDLRNNRELVMVDCSNYARAAPMIYPDMAITHLGKLAQRGEIFYCSVLFTQITKVDVVSVDLYVQETTIDGVETVLWSKNPFEPTNTESLSALDESEDNPAPRRAPIEAMPSSIKPGGLVNNIIDWVAGLF